MAAIMSVYGELALYDVDDVLFTLASTDEPGSEGWLEKYTKQWRGQYCRHETPIQLDIHAHTYTYTHTHTHTHY